MFQQSEAKFQHWRAVAVFKDGGEGQLYVSRSTTHVRTGYATAYVELLDAEERAYASRISLQCWEGADKSRGRKPRGRLAVGIQITRRGLR